MHSYPDSSGGVPGPDPPNRYPLLHEQMEAPVEDGRYPSCLVVFLFGSFFQALTLLVSYLLQNDTGPLSPCFVLYHPSNGLSCSLRTSSLFHSAKNILAIFFFYFYSYCFLWP